MGQKNLKKIFLGVTLLIGGGVCVSGAIFLLQKPAVSSVESLPPKVSPQHNADSEVIDIRAKFTPHKSDIEEKVSQSESIDLSALLSDAENIYGSEEVNRTEGVMWIDREESRYVVTLGAVNGLKQGSQLSVYEGDDVIGKVSVDTLLDVISYVAPAGSDHEKLKDNYYKVIFDSR